MASTRRRLRGWTAAALRALRLVFYRRGLPRSRGAGEAYR